MRRVLSILIFFSLSAVAFETQAQRARLYSSANGEISGQINDIFQDRQGFLWISTDDGLFRFDGMNFTTFRHQSGNASSLSGNSTVFFFEDSRGTKWVGTPRGLQCFHPLYNRFEPIRLENSPERQSVPYISSMVEYSTGEGSELYVSTSQHGIYVMDSRTHRLNSEKREAIGRKLLSGFISRLYIDSGGRLWICYENGGLTLLDLRTLDAAGDVLWEAPLRGIWRDITITSIAEDPWTGNVILGTFSDGILVFDTSMKVIRKAKKAGNVREGVMSLLYNDRYAPHGKRSLLAGLENNGLWLFDPDTEELQKCHLANVPFSTECWKVHNLMEDRQGNVWVGAYHTGLMVLPRSMYGFESMTFSVRGIPGENSACVTSVAEGMSEDALWVGTDGGGLFFVEGREVKGNYSSSNTCLYNNSIMTLQTDRRHTLWIGTWYGGLYTCSPTKAFSPFPENGALHSNKIFSMAYDAASDYLFAGTSGGGLSVIDALHRKVVATFDADNYKWISSLCMDNKGVLWVGTFNGLMRLQTKTLELQEVNLGDSYRNLRIASVRPVENGLVWLGTNMGLLSFNPTTGITSEVKVEGITDDVFKDILESVTGDLWFSTSKGLTRFSPSTRQASHYYAYDGLQGSDFRSRSAFQHRDGRLFFGGVNGLTSIMPREIDKYRHDVPPVCFSQVTVMNEPVDYESAPEKENVLDRHVAEATRMEIDHAQNVFSIGFSVLEYTNPQKIVFSYKMEGFDGQWTQTTSGNPTATYTNLPAGHYTFRVRAFFDGTPDTFSERELAIHIRPEWYARWWALCLYVLILGLVIWQYRYWLVKRMELTRRDEDARLNEMRLSLFTNMTHEIRTPLTLVMSPLKRMREAETVPQLKDIYNLMYRNCIRINRIVNQLMDIRKIDEGKMPMHFVETDIVYFIRDIMFSFDELASSKHIDFSLYSVREVENLWIDQGNFDKVIFNILSNAFKFTPENGTIRIFVSSPAANAGLLDNRIREYVQVEIFNTGSRLEDKDLDKVFERFYQANVSDAKVGSGVGLNLSKLLMDLHHGDIRVRNEEDGVCFVVTVPVGNSHLTPSELSITAHHKGLYSKDSVPSSPNFVHEDALLIPSPSESSPLKTSKNKRNMVIVDDDEEFRGYLLQVFRNEYNVTLFPNGEEAWPHIVTQIPDVVIADYLMPQMDGLELCRKIKANRSTDHIPVLMLTSQADEKSEQLGSEAGADRYLTKPVSIELLSSAVQQAITTRVAMRNKFSNSLQYDYQSIQMDNARNQLLGMVVEIIRKNIDNPDLCVEDISREVGMSRVNLNRRLKDEANISPSALIRSTRLRQAAYLLINNDVNISEVAYKVGFSTHSYFSSSFHDYYGMSPKEFVQKYQNCKDEEVLAKLFG